MIDWAGCEHKAHLGCACDRAPDRSHPRRPVLAAPPFAMLQSLVVPALPTLQQDLDTTPTGVTWIFTTYLLAASVATPIAGRLGDMFGKKRVLVLVLTGLAAGTLLAALATALPVMIAARTIQGLGGAIFPLSFGIIRDEFPRERVAAGSRSSPDCSASAAGSGSSSQARFSPTSTITGSSGSRSAWSCSR